MQPDLFGAETPVGGSIDFTLPVLSIRQPWAWFILHGGKDVENRCWQHAPKYRGRFLIHASSGCTKAEYDEAVNWVHERKLVDLDKLVAMPYVRRDFCPRRVAMREAIERGGIVGEATLWKVTQGEPPRGWYTGEVGLWLRDVKPLPFYPCKGALGFFRIGKEGC